MRRAIGQVSSSMMGSSLQGVRKYIVSGAQSIAQHTPMPDLSSMALKTSRVMTETMSEARVQAQQAISKAATKSMEGMQSGASYIKKEGVAVVKSYDVRRPLKYAAGSVAFETAREYMSEHDHDHDPFKAPINELEKNTLGIYEKAVKSYDAVTKGDAVEIDKLRQKYPMAASGVDATKSVIGTENAVLVGIAFNVLASEGPAVLVNCAHAGAKIAVNTALHPVMAEERIMSFAGNMMHKLQEHAPSFTKTSEAPISTPTVQKPKGLGSGGMQLD